MKTQSRPKVPKICQYKDCGRQTHRYDRYCPAHDARFKRGRDMDAPIQGRTKNDGNCRLSLCDRPAHIQLLCARHYELFRRARKSGTVELGLWKRHLRRIQAPAYRVHLGQLRLDKHAASALARYAEMRDRPIMTAAREIITQWLFENEKIRSSALGLLPTG